MNVDPHILGWLLILFGACGFYALVLHKLDHRYEPNGTIFTVIGGNSLIICGLYGMEQSGALAPGTVAVVTAANVAAGIPIAIWQLIQYVARKARNGHHEEHLWRG
jgi:hypothetical protein